MVIRIPDNALAALDVMCRAAGGLETGGVLAADEIATEVVVVTHVSDAGPTAVRTRDRLEWDPEHIAAQLGYLSDRPRIFGRWHKHCGPVLLASEEDRRGAEAFRAAVGAEAVLDIIVATEDDRPIGWAAYLCTKRGYERPHLDLPSGERV